MEEPRDESGYPGFQGLEAIAKRMREKKLPKHETVILRNNRGFYVVRCSICGQIGKQYKYHKFAEYRKDTHDRGQDTGSGS